MRYKLLFVVILILCACKEPRSIIDNDNSQKSKAFITAFHEGLRLKLQGNYNKAIERFEFCLQEEPRDDASHFAMAQTFLLLGDLAQAETYTISAVELDKDNVFYQVELAYMLRNKGAFEESGALFETIISSRPREIEYYLLAIDSYRKARNFNAAIGIVDRLEDLKGNVVESALRRHSIYVEMGKLKEAEKGLLQLHDQLPKNPMILATLVDFYFQQGLENKGIQNLKLLVDVDPQNGIGNLMLGEYAYQQGNTEIASKYFYQAIQSQNISSNESLNAFEYLVFVNDTLKINNSIEILEDVFVDNDTVLSALGDYYFQHSIKAGTSKTLRNRALKMGIDQYNKALELNPNRFDLWRKLLYFYYDAKRWEVLRKTAEQTVRIFPFKPEPFYLGAVALNQLNEYALAESFARQGLMAVVDDRVLESDLLGQLGESFFSKGALKQGMVYYLQAIEIGEKATYDYLSFNLSLRLYENKYELNKAIKILDDALLKQIPKQVTFELLKADLFFIQERYNEALEVLSVLESDDPFLSSGILERTGDVMSMLKNNAEAVILWEKALNLDKGSLSLKKKIKTGGYVE